LNFRNPINMTRGERIMKKKAALCVNFVCTLVFIAAAYAGDTGTREEAVAMVKKAVAYIQANGKDKAFEEFSNQKGQFVDRDLYVVAYDLTGKCLAHGQKANMVGKDLIDMKDPDGKEFIKERIELMKKQNAVWQDYKFMNPITKQIEPKSMYLERCQDFAVGCGIYKK
jgi:cytochrome c